MRKLSLLSWSHLNEGPFYDPPYESQLEDIFALTIIKYLNTSIDFQKQVEVDTICGKFRIDFIADCGSKKVAFECDGREYHNESRDEWRDAMILGSKAVDVIYRLRGSDLTYHIEDCLFVISKNDPEIFSPRGLINLEVLTSDETRRHELEDGEETIMITYRQTNNIAPLFIFIERRSREIPSGKRAFWKHLFEYAKKQGGGNLDELIARSQNEWIV